MKTESRDKYERSDPVLDAAFEALRPDADGEGIVPPSDELSERRRCLEILAIHRAAAAPRKTLLFRPRRWGAVAVGTLLAVALGIPLTLLFTQRPHRVSPPSPSPASVPIERGRAVIPGSRIALLTGDVYLESAKAIMGARLPSSARIKTKGGHTALSLPSGIGVGLAENTSVRVLWDGKTQYGISIQSGMALFSVDPLQSAHRDGFFVDTPAGTVHVTGTLFTVLVSKAGSVFVQLHRGELLVENPGGVPEVVTPGPLTRLGDNGKAEPELAERVSGQLQALSCMAVDDIFSELSHVSCLVHATSNAEADETADNADRVNRPRRPSAKPLSIKELMDLARSRKTDADWQGAAEAYRTLIRRYPSSNEARTARVSLAQIQLRRLNRPKSALIQFSKYLRAPGPLTQEALFGKAEALRALGNSREEAGVLLDILITFPNGVYAKPAKKRLRALRVDQVPH